MPTMPNLVGLEFQAAQLSLQQAGVLSPPLLGFFFTYPVKAIWQASLQPVNTVLTQNPSSGANVAVNASVTVTVSQPKISVAFP